MTDSTDPTLPADLRVGVVGMGIGHLHLLCWLGVKGASAVAIAGSTPGIYAHRL